MRVDELTGRALVDTNVLIYATLTADPRHERAKRVLELRHLSGVELFVSVQNLAEMYPNLTGPKNQPPDTPTIARDKIKAISRLRGLTVLPLTQETVQSALEVCVEGAVTRQAYFDCQLAALMLREKIPVILTENTKDFADIAGVIAIDPLGMDW
jgi:predicted nucleic acid-binding protein